MCYSAQIKALYFRYLKEFGAYLSIREFVELYRLREADKRIRIPKAVDLHFAGSQDEGEGEQQLRDLIEAHNARQAAEWEAELFKQRRRRADAERTLQAKATKAAAESRRIATDKVEWLLGKLADLRRMVPEDRDSRFFPGWYAPVMVVENGRRVVKPMRYQCRPAGKPAHYDARYPGTYNARRDNLGGFWKGLFGATHGLLVINAFYENVSRDGRNAILEFRPRPSQDMLVACLWSRWSAPGEPDLLSFAAITDQPPPEVAAAGHDRCVIPIKAEHIDRWLNPATASLEELQAILDDRERPYYEHRLAA
jgi:putative SOS response-associated peptidase YedK